MPNHWVALVSTALPIIACLTCMVLLFSHACIYWGQWEQYDDMYYYSHNYRGSQRFTLLNCAFINLWFILCCRGAKGNGVFPVDHVGMDIWLTTRLPWSSISTDTFPSI